MLNYTFPFIRAWKVQQPADDEEIIVEAKWNRNRERERKSINWFDFMWEFHDIQLYVCTWLTPNLCNNLLLALEPHQNEGVTHEVIGSVSDKVRGVPRSKIIYWTK